MSTALKKKKACLKITFFCFVFLLFYLLECWWNQPTVTKKWLIWYLLVLSAIQWRYLLSCQDKYSILLVWLIHISDVCSRDYLVPSGLLLKASGYFWLGWELFSTPSPKCVYLWHFHNPQIVHWSLAEFILIFDRKVDLYIVKPVHFDR